MITRIFRDLRVIYAIVFGAQKRSSNTDTHEDNLERFYKSQVAEYDRFREHMLWGRTPLLHAVAAHMPLVDRDDLVWVDIGGGTGSNVEKMADIVSLNTFKAIYIVDLCPSMCAEAMKRVERMGWKNVHVVKADAATFKLPTDDAADLVTFSYSLSMIPDFHAAVDNAYTMLADDGMIGITDFGVNPSSSWIHRMFWLSFFDIDGIHLGPERKQYVMHRFKTHYEYGTTGRLPYTVLNAPYFIWLGHKPHHDRSANKNVMIKRSKAPAFFPPTFLYHQSWEDPDVDHPVLDVQPSDVCLTLTSGGCNTLYLLLQGAKQVVSVDVNPAQTALLELKSVAIKYLEYEDFWKLFGEGKHEDFDVLFETKLAPFMSVTSRRFWERKKHYFKNGLYFHGSMGKVCKFVKSMSSLLGMTDVFEQIVNADTLVEQNMYYDQLLDRLPQTLQNTFVTKMIGHLTLNNVVAWYAGGVPSAQLSLIKQDDINVLDYFKRCIHNMIKRTHIKTANYFYYNILTGTYTRTNCPAYLKPDNFAALKNGLIDNLYISNDLFLNELQQRSYDKVILMDHADWQNEQQTMELADTLYRQVNKGGKVIFRSAGLVPPYAQHLEDAGFNVTCVDSIDRSGYMDRVNMYASFYVCTK